MGSESETLSNKARRVTGVFTDYRTLLEQDHLDAVVVATPDDLRFQMTMNEAQIGPLTIPDALTRNLDANNIKVMEALWKLKKQK